MPYNTLIPFKHADILIAFSYWFHWSQFLPAIEASLHLSDATELMLIIKAENYALKMDIYVTKCH